MFVTHNSFRRHDGSLFTRARLCVCGLLSAFLFAETTYVLTPREHINRISLQDADHLGQEEEKDSVEYKWKLSQMKYRVTEGQGEFINEITGGVTDDGLPKGLRLEALQGCSTRTTHALEGG